MGLVRTVEPAATPVSLSEAKLNLGVIDSVEDWLITLAIGEATRYAEAYCGLSLITQQWRMTFDCFPPRVLKLERGPVQSVNSIQYLDMAGVLQTVSNPAAPAWAIDLDADRARIAPGFGYTWPVTLPQIAAVRVNFTAGFGAAGTAVPDGIRNWILGRVAAVFENREEVAVLQRGGALTAMPHFDRMLDPYRVLEA